LLLAGCGERGTLGVLPPDSIPTQKQTVLIATSRATAPAPVFFSDTRSYKTNFAEVEVSIPPDREVGTLEYPQRGEVDPSTEFLIASSTVLDGNRGFTRALNAELATLPASSQIASIFVHGFNTNHAEGVMRAVALAKDTGREGVQVVYTWPSAGSVLKYLDDRESALFARDSLKETLAAVSQSRVSDYLVVGHSMGTFVVMDAMRELAQQNQSATLSKIKAVVLISADLDIDVFRRQAPPVLAAGVPIVLLTTDDDLALSASAKIRGQGDRVGDIKSTSELGGMKIPVFDLSNVTTGDALRHFKIGSSPEILDFLRSLNEGGTGAIGGTAGGPVLSVDSQSLESATGIVVTE